jgi:predicted transcriptional regulator
MNDKTWRKNLNKWRDEMGLTEKQAANAAGIAQKTLDKLLKLYKKDYSDLFTKQIPVKVIEKHHIKKNPS